MLLPCLPSDVSELITFHLSAMTIQHRIRTFLFRHTLGIYWKQIRDRLIECLHIYDFDILQSNHRVRGEWYFEPMSWLDNDIANIDIIVKEVKSGLWK